MSEKSGIDMIKEILEKVSLFDARLTNIEQNMKELLNRANGFGVNKNPEVKVQLKPSITSSEEVKEANTIKTLGRIKNKDGKSLIGVDVSIADRSGKVIKTTKTNRAGEWLSFLPPGSYIAKYFMENQINASVSFNVEPNQTLIRVAQPKNIGV